MGRVPSPFPDRQGVTWQLISVNVDRQTSDDIEVIKEKLLGLEHARNGTLAILSVQETKSWDIPIWSSRGSDKFSTINRSWETEERCTEQPW